MAVIGIDLGTTNSCAARYDGAAPVILSSARTDGLVPSVVMFRKGEFLVGQPALDFAHKDPANVIWSIKRLMGRAYEEPQIEEVRQRVNYSIVRAAAGDAGVRVELGGRQYSPVDISAMILERIKNDAEKSLGEKVTHAVITVPAYFEERQRAATRLAGEKAGLIVKKIIDEPSAAAIAYGFTVSKGARKHLLVFDLGGGTFDVSIIDTVMDHKSVNHFEVLDTRGNNWLGGDDFDRAIVGEMAAQIRRTYDYDPSGDATFQWLAKRAAEGAKIALSTCDRTEITLPAVQTLKTPQGNIIDLEMTLTRSCFEALIRPYVEKAIECVHEGLRHENLGPGQIDVVLLVGGATLVPLVYEKVAGIFGREKVKQVSNPFHSVAQGAGILAAALRGVQCPRCGAENDEARRQCAGCGAALAGAVSAGGISLTEVTPMHFGIKAVRGDQSDAFEIIIPKGEIYPLKEPKTREFQMTAENFIRVPVYEGMEPLASRNEEQGTIELGAADFQDAGENAPAGTIVSVSMNYNGNREVDLRIHVHGTRVEKTCLLRHDRPRQAAASGPDVAKLKGELEFLLGVAARLEAKYRSYMEPRQQRRLQADVGRATKALESDNAAELRNTARALSITLHSCGVASTLFLAEEVQSGAPPERARKMNEAVQRIKQTLAEGKTEEASAYVDGLTAAIAAELRRQTREVPGQRDFGGLLRVRDA